MLKLVMAGDVAVGDWVTLYPGLVSPQMVRGVTWIAPNVATRLVLRERETLEMPSSHHIWVSRDEDDV